MSRYPLPAILVAIVSINAVVAVICAAILKHIGKRKQTGTIVTLMERVRAIGECPPSWNSCTFCCQEECDKQRDWWRDACLLNGELSDYMALLETATIAGVDSKDASAAYHALRDLIARAIQA